MSLSYTFTAAERVMAADQRLATALATIRRARGTERPDPPPSWQPGPSAIICWQGEVLAELAEVVAALVLEAKPPAEQAP